MSADTLSHDHRGQSGLTSGFRCDAVDPRRDSSAPIHPVCGDDAALIVALALAHARKGNGGAATVPGAILDRLTALADRGEPACQMVHAWLARQTAGGDRPIHPIHATKVKTPVTLSPPDIPSAYPAFKEEC